MDFKELCHRSHTTASTKGFWEDTDAMRAHVAPLGDKALEVFDNLVVGQKVALVSSELGEVIEGVRHGNPPSEKIPDFSAAEEEFADAVIRIMDTCEKMGWDLEGAILAKMDYNDGRPYKHGKSF